MTRAKSSGGSRRAGTAVPMPALLISTSTWPSSADGLLDDAPAVLRVRDVGLDGDAAPAGLLHPLLGVAQFAGTAGADGDVGARLGQPGGEGHPQTRGGAGDDCHLVLQ